MDSLIYYSSVADLLCRVVVYIRALYGFGVTTCYHIAATLNCCPLLVRPFIGVHYCLRRTAPFTSTHLQLDCRCHATHATRTRVAVRSSGWAVCLTGGHVPAADISPAAAGRAAHCHFTVHCDGPCLSRMYDVGTGVDYQVS